jgi:hypothetical protein
MEAATMINWSKIIKNWKFTIRILAKNSKTLRKG